MKIELLVHRCYMYVFNTSYNLGTQYDILSLNLVKKLSLSVFVKVFSNIS